MKLTISKALALASLVQLAAELDKQLAEKRKKAIKAVRTARKLEVKQYTRMLKTTQLALARAKARVGTPIPDDVLQRFIPQENRVYNNKTGDYGPTKTEQVAIERRRLSMVESDQITIEVESALGQLLGL